MADSRPNRGEVWRVVLDPVIGSEQGKTRPCVVVSTARFADLDVRLVVPITSWQGRFTAHPNKYFLAATPENGLTSDSAADGLHVRSVSVARFRERLGELAAPDLEQVVALIGLVTGRR